MSGGLFAWNDGTRWASVGAGSTVNAYICVNYILAVTSGDSTSGAFAFASSTHYTIVGNYVSHKTNFKL